MYLKSPITKVAVGGKNQVAGQKCLGDVVRRGRKINFVRSRLGLVVTLLASHTKYFPSCTFPFQLRKRDILQHPRPLTIEKGTTGESYTTRHKTKSILWAPEKWGHAHTTRPWLLSGQFLCHFRGKKNFFISKNAIKCQILPFWHFFMYRAKFLWHFLVLGNPEQDPLNPSTTALQQTRHKLTRLKRAAASELFPAPVLPQTPTLSPASMRRLIPLSTGGRSGAYERETFSNSILPWVSHLKGGENKCKFDAIIIFFVNSFLQKTTKDRFYPRMNYFFS